MTLTDILTAVHNLELSVAEAEPLVLQVCAARNAFATAALEGQLATGIRRACKETLAVECFQYADAMLAASGAVVAGPDVAQRVQESIAAAPRPLVRQPAEVVL